MTWSNIILAIIRLLGPVIAEWLEDILDRASYRMSYRPSESYDAVRLVDRAIHDTPWWLLWRRMMLRRVRRAVLDHVRIIDRAVTCGEAIQPLTDSARSRYGL